MLTYEQCGYCKGRGQAQRLEERRESGWFPNTMLAHDVADAWISADGERAPLRWTDCACPQCNGEGSYAVEHFQCKIF